MNNSSHNIIPTRRQFLLVTGGFIGGIGCLPVFMPREAHATPETMAAAIRQVAGQVAIKPGKVKLDLPPIVENGNAVPITVSVDSPMTSADYVKGIYIFNEKNPQPNVANFHLGPRAGKPIVATRMRLADSQKVIAIAELSDGTFWSDSADLIVTIAACIEGD